MRNLVYSERLDVLQATVEAQMAHGEVPETIPLNAFVDDSTLSIFINNQTVVPDTPKTPLTVTIGPFGAMYAVRRKDRWPLEFDYYPTPPNPNVSLVTEPHPIFNKGVASLILSRYLDTEPALFGVWEVESSEEPEDPEADELLVLCPEGLQFFANIIGSATNGKLKAYAQSQEQTVPPAQL